MSESPDFATKKVLIKTSCKNKAKNEQYASEWPLEVDNMGSGRGDFEGQYWINEVIGDIGDDLDICTLHCKPSVKIMDEADNKYSAATTLNKRCYKFVNPLRDNIIIKIEDKVICSSDSCKIRDFSTAAIPTVGKKRAALKTRSRPKKRRKTNPNQAESGNDDDDEEEDEDDIASFANKIDGSHSTDSEEDDVSKHTKKSKKKKKKKASFSPVLWGKFLETMVNQHGDTITMPGIVVWSKECYESDEFPAKIPDHILKKYRKPKECYSTQVNHSNYSNIRKPQRPPYGHYNNMHSVQHSIQHPSYSIDSNEMYQMQSNQPLTLSTYHGNHNNNKYQSREQLNERYNYHNRAQYQYSDYLHHEQSNPNSLPPPVFHPPQQQQNQQKKCPSPNISDHDNNTNSNNSIHNE